MTAAKNNPPFDVLLLDEGPMLEAIPLGIFAPFPADKSKNNAELGAPFQSTSVGPTVTVQLIGIAYNPKTITTPPTSWLDLWKPEYKGRVGLPDIESSLGTVFMVEVAKLKGGSEKNLQPAFDALKELLPNVGAIAPNPGAIGTLFQQGQIDIAPFYFNNTLLIAAKDVDIAFVRPETGLVLVRTSMHIAKNTKVMDAALGYIDAALSADVQQQLQAAPYYLVPDQRQGEVQRRHNQGGGRWARPAAQKPDPGLADDQSEPDRVAEGIHRDGPRVTTRKACRVR